GAPDPQRRIPAAQETYNNPNPKMLGAVHAQLSKEPDAGGKTALDQAGAAIIAAAPDAANADVLRALSALAGRGDKSAENLVKNIEAKHDDPAVHKAADSAISDI